MDITDANEEPGTSVRWPFRILAGLVAVSGLVAFIGFAYMGFSRGPSSVPVRSVIAVPGMFWLLRIAAYASVKGRAPSGSEYWPFASKRVAIGYFVIFLVSQYFS